jgi:hypothetical protein
MSKKQLTLLKELIAETKSDLASYGEEQKNFIKNGDYKFAAENSEHRKVKEYYLWRLSLIKNGQTIQENQDHILRKVRRQKKKP